MYICTRYIPKTNTRYYSTLYNTSLKLVHKNTTINSTIRGGGGSPSSLFVAVSPVPQGGVRPFIVLSYRYRLLFYRYRYRIVEPLSLRYYRFFIEWYYRNFRYYIQHCKGISSLLTYMHSYPLRVSRITVYTYAFDVLTPNASVTGWLSSSRRGFSSFTWKFRGCSDKPSKQR